jgi:hypothetical protein
MVHRNTLCGQNAANLYIETGGTLDIKGLKRQYFIHQLTHLGDIPYDRFLGN